MEVWSPLPGLSMFNSQETQHRHHCPYLSRSKKSIILSVRISRIGFLLSKTIQFSVKFSYGVGICSISHHLNFAGVIYPESPAFAWWDRTSNSLWSIRAPMGNGTVHLSQCLQELEQLFQDQKASPSDVNQDGETLLHVVATYLTYLQPDLQLPLIEGLVKLGVPANELTFNQRTFLDVVLDAVLGSAELNVLATTRSLYAGGAEFYNPMLENVWRWDICLMVECLRLEDLAHTFQCGRLSRAVVAKSLPAMTQILSSNPDAIHEKNALGQTPLHLSADWFEGIKALIDAHADVNATDRFGQCPISLACHARNIAAVQLFLEADCNFWRGSEISSAMTTVLDDAILCKDDHIIEIVIENLLRRRERLETIAKTDAAVVTDAKVFDKDCFHVNLELRKADVHVPDSLMVPYSTTVFHSLRSIPRHVLTQLERSGFLDIFQTDHRGLTPLAMATLKPQYHKDLINWILIKYLEGSQWNNDHWYSTSAATNQDKSVQWSNFALLTYSCSLRCGYLLREWENNSLHVFKPFFQLQRQILFHREATSVHHQCRCPCNIDLNECTNLLLSLRTILGGCRATNETTPSEVFQFLIGVAIVYGIHSLSRRLGVQLVRQIMRLVCMELLVIPHTCCRVRQISEWRYDGHGILCRRVEDHDIEEVLEEYKGAISQLEALVDMFSAKESFVSLGLSDIWLFLIDHFWDSPKVDAPTEEMLRNIRATGIIIHNAEDRKDWRVGETDDYIFYGYHRSFYDFRGVYKTTEELRAMAKELENPAALA